MNISGRLISMDFTVLADVKTLMQSTGTADTTYDTMVSETITAVSREFTDYLGWHTLEAARTEMFQTNVHARMITLDAVNVDTTPANFELKLNGTGKDWSETIAEDADNYHVHPAAGYVRLLYPIRRVRGYAQVTYTGGFGTSASDLKTNYPDLARACALQTKYAVGRLRTLGGDVTPGAGSGTSFGGQYGMLTAVRRILDRHRKAEV